MTLCRGNIITYHTFIKEYTFKFTSTFKSIINIFIFFGLEMFLIRISCNLNTFNLFLQIFFSQWFNCHKIGNLFVKFNHYIIIRSELNFSQGFLVQTPNPESYYFQNLACLTFFCVRINYSRMRIEGIYLITKLPFLFLYAMPSSKTIILSNHK